MKTKEKKKNKGISKKHDDLFKEPWCPLFGEIPHPFEYEPASQIRRCIEIILRSREIWDIDNDSWMLFKKEHSFPSWPEPEEIDYPQDLILAAREISRLSPEIYRDAVLSFPMDTGEPVYYKKEDGTSDTCNSLDTVPEYAIKAVKHLALGKARDTIEKLPEFAILAILTIDEAWLAFRFIEEDGEPEESPSVIKSVQNASGLLNHALDLIHKEEINLIEKEKEDSADDILRGQKVIEGAKAGGKERGKEIRKLNEEKRKAWQEEDKIIREQYPTLKFKTDRAKLIRKRLKAQGK
ncbi:MAG: hypothetical protein L6290_10335, partial [Thermodesulfovibrionales bacterium]|nr:hypothetical protein [Thermodesulfovibrionales bacterium]